MGSPLYFVTANATARVRFSGRQRHNLMTITIIQVSILDSLTILLSYLTFVNLPKDNFANLDLHM